MIQLVGNKNWDTETYQVAFTSAIFKEWRFSKELTRGHTSQSGNQQVHKDLNTK